MVNRILWGSVIFIAACAGKVSDGGDDVRSPAEILEEEGESLCAQACAMMVDCYAERTDDCACVSAPCDCGGAPTPSECESDCKQSNAELGAACAEQALAILQCVSAEVCTSMDELSVRCRAQAEAAEECSRGQDVDDPPSVGTPAVPPPSSGPVCDAGSWGSGGGVGPNGPVPGDPACSEGCSDSSGLEWSVDCVYAVEGVSCTCLRAGVIVSGFTAAECTGYMLDECAWEG